MLPNWLVAAWLASCAGDAVSTHAALNTGRAYEKFQTQNPWVDDVIIAGQGASAWWATSKLSAQHPRLARVMLIGLTGIRVYAIAHNVQTARR